MVFFISRMTEGGATAFLQQYKQTGVNLLPMFKLMELIITKRHTMKHLPR